MKGVPNPRDVVAASIKEEDWTSTVLQLAKMQGWLVTHFRPAMDARGRWSTPLAGDPGFPDFVLARRPRLITAELKAQTGMLSLAQRHWLTELEGCTQLESYTWRPSDAPTVMQKLAR